MAENITSDNPNWILCDETGSALIADKKVEVFIVPVYDEIPQRRLFLWGVEPGVAIPGIRFERDGHVVADYYTLLLVPEEETTYTKTQCTDKIEEEFAKECGIPFEQTEEGRTFGEFDTLGECLCELWEMQDVLELRTIYAANMANVAARDENIRRILSAFGKRSQVSNEIKHTGKPLYDAMAVLCSYQKINLKTWDEIRTVTGSKPSVHDISRISNFACRELILAENWYKQDNGPLLVYYGNKRIPMACIPKSSKSYLIYDPETDTTEKLTSEMAAQIRPKGACLYRPFPEKTLTKKEIIRYCLDAVRVGDVVTVVLFTLIGVLVGQLLPFLNQTIFDKYIPMGDVGGLYGICLVVLAFSIGNVFFQLISSMASFRFLNRIKYQLEAAIVDRLFSLPEPFYRDYESADLAERAMTIADMFTKLMEIVLKNSLTALFSFIYLRKMFKCSTRLSWIAIIMCLVFDGIGIGFGFLQMKYEKKKMNLEGRISSLLYQLVSGVGKLRIAGAEERGLREYTKVYTESIELNIQSQNAARMANAVSIFSGTLITAVLYYSMIHRNLGLSIGAFMAFNSAYGSFSGAIGTLVSSFLEVNNMGPAIDRVRPILREEPECNSALALPGDLMGGIELNNVRFSYSESDPEILHGISLSVQPGEYIGIVGETGGGKSTLFKLMLGFETPTTGKIYYDGMDIDTIDKRELRKKFGVVLQDGGLITGSIYENITITHPTATEDEVNEAIRNAGLEEDIKKMPMGLNTLLSEGDGSVSGGQKQRILIARAIVGKPKILFFDEATSALDNNTQKTVINALDALHSTRIVIAHRLSTIINCDRIIVLKGGLIEEMGNFDELMAKKGLFYELASRQIS